MIELVNRLQWRHMRLIHAIDATGQLSLAAQKLSMTQPAASRMLAELEGILEHKLFERTPKGMKATPLSQVLVNHADSLIRGLDAAIRDVQEFSTGKTGSVKVGAVTGAAVAYVVPAIQALKLEIPSGEFDIHVAPSSVLMLGLLNREYDFILSRIPPHRDVRDLNVLNGNTETIEFLMRRNHPLLSVKNPGLKDLARFNWVVQATGTPLRQAVQEAFIAQGFDLPEQIISTSSLLVMISYLQTSDFISPLSSEVAEVLATSGAGGMCAIKTQKPIVISPYHFIQHKNYLLPPLASRLGLKIVELMNSG